MFSDEDILDMCCELGYDTNALMDDFSIPVIAMRLEELVKERILEVLDELLRNNEAPLLEEADEMSLEERLCVDWDCRGENWLPEGETRI